MKASSTRKKSNLKSRKSTRKSKSSEISDYTWYSAKSNSNQSSSISVIGKGTYGCVIKPGIPCASWTSNRDMSKKISKFMRKEDADAEIKMYEFLKQIDPQSKYTPSPPVDCVPKITTELMNKYKQSCGKRVSIDDTHIITMDYEGETIYRWMERIVAQNNKQEQRKLCIQIFHALAEAIQGIVLFQKYKFVHADIKLNNLVYNQYTNKVKIIDFGISHSMDYLREALDAIPNGILHDQYGFDFFLRDDEVEAQFNEIINSSDSKREFKTKATEAMHDLIYIYNMEGMDLFTLNDIIEKYNSFGFEDGEIDTYIKKTMIPRAIEIYYNTQSLESFNDKAIYGIDTFAYAYALHLYMEQIYMEGGIIYYREYDNLIETVLPYFTYDIDKRIMNANHLYTDVMQYLATLR